MSIASLPSEIIFHTVSYLDSAHDVAALSLSCRAVHSECQLTLRNMRFHLVRICPDNRSIEATFQLLMEILKQPKLGQHVQEIRYYGRPDGSGDWTMMSDQKLYPRDLPDSDMDLLRTHVQKAGFSGSAAESVLVMLVQQKTGDDLGQENYLDTPGIGWKASHRGIFIAQALAAIFISVAPSLVSLAMTQPWKTWSSHRGYYPLEQFLLQANSNPEDKPYLRNLREVYIMADEAGIFEPGERDDDRFYIHIDFLNCFRMFDKLPSIESVGVDGLTDDDQDEPIIEQEISNITVLRINHSALSELYLARAILACKALKIFQYTIGGRGQLEPRGHINNRTFSKAILKHKNALEVLDVDSENDFSHYGNEDDDYNSEGPDQFMEYLEEGEDEDTIEFLRSFWENHGSLKEFPKLNSLSLGIGLLMYLAHGANGTWDTDECGLVNSLPQTLEYLTIRGYERGEVPRHDAQIDSLMAAYNSGSLGLKEIRGVDIMIPFAEHHDIDGDESGRWCLQKSGYGIENIGRGQKLPQWSSQFSSKRYRCE